MDTTDLVESGQEQTEEKKRFEINITWQDVLHWLKTHPLDTFLLLLILFGIILTLNPLPNVTGADRWIQQLPASMRVKALQSVQWIAHEGGAQISGSIFFVIGAAVGIWRLRQGVTYSKKMWSTYCPECQEHHTLKRIHRTNKDKFLNYLTVPSKRYRCRECKWEGLRIDENLI